MKKIKRFLASLMVAVIVLTAAPLSGFVELELNLDWFDFNTKASAATYSGKCGDNLIWSLDTETGELIISGEGKMPDYSTKYSNGSYITGAPWSSYVSSIRSVTIQNGATSIGSYAFYGCTRLTSITIPDSVTSIGDFAFSYCKSLTSITIPDSVTSIGFYAFEGCTSLTSITIPDSVTSIGKDAFYNTSYYNDSSNWEDDVLYIGNHLIKAKTSISGGYTIKEGTMSIGPYTFEGCTSLTSITIPDSVTSIGDHAFWRNSLTSVTIPDSVTSIGSGAFESCTSLTNITIPDGVTSIGSYTFCDCTSLTNITIPDGVTSIGHSAFRNTGYYNDSSNWEDDVLYIGNHLIEANTSISGAYTIKEGTMSIGPYAFYECTSLTSITIPDSVTSIGDYAFDDCGKLEKVIFKRSDYIELGTDFLVYSPNAMICCEEGSYLHAYTEVNNMKVCIFDENGVPSFVVQNDVLLSYRGESKDVFVSAGTKIGYGAFENNSVVETVVLSSSVSRIYGNAFKNCSSLETIIIPESVTSIGAGAFVGCKNLTILCYAGSYADSYASANGIDVEYIALDIEKDILILTLGEPSSLTASLNTPYAENSGVVWSSTNTSIATVDGNGNVKGIKAGTAVIVATSKDGGLRDYCVVKVVGIEALSTATIDHENGIITGLSSNLDSLDGYVEISDPAYNLSYDSLGTDSIVYVECDGEIIDAYSVVIFGDVNGDSWYDGQDAIIVDCLANGMLTKDDVSEAVYMAADCNHDGVIDQLDVALLNEAGTLLANVDQSKSAEVLIETSSAYVEYLDLIDQSFEIEDETEDVPEADVETEDTTPEQDVNTEINIFEMIMKFIRSIIEMILTYIPVTYK